MAREFLYLPSNKNIGKLFEKIQSAKQPEVFNHPYLLNVIGLKGTGDRPLITMLKSLEFLDGSGRPTPTYALLKNKNTAGSAIADAVRKAYAGLFAANEKANEITGDELKGLISQVAGTDEDATNRIFYTFQSLTKVADFKTPLRADKSASGEGGAKAEDEENAANKRDGRFRPDFHYNIQVHLPSNGTEETYLNIFNAIRKTFQ